MATWQGSFGGRREGFDTAAPGESYEACDIYLCDEGDSGAPSDVSNRPSRAERENCD